MNTKNCSNKSVLSTQSPIFGPSAQVWNYRDAAWPRNSSDQAVIFIASITTLIGVGLPIASFIVKQKLSAERTLLVWKKYSVQAA